MDVGEAALDAVVVEGEPLVVDAEEVEHGGVEVVPVHWLFDCFVTDVVGRAVREAMLKACAGEPDSEAVLIVVAAGADGVGA